MYFKYFKKEGSTNAPLGRFVRVIYLEAHREVRAARPNSSLLLTILSVKSVVACAINSLLPEPSPRSWVKRHITSESPTAGRSAILTNPTTS